MAKQHPSGVTGADMQADTDAHAKTYHQGTLDDERDELIVLGKGVYLSRSRQQSYEIMASRSGSKYYKLGIPQETILAWADEIRTADGMAKSRRQTVRDDRSVEHEANCYPGTDTHDPMRDPRIFRERRNQFEVDRSQSTIHFGVSSGHRDLNGSAVTHQHCIRIEVNGPDGRHICEVLMSFDQFASALISNMNTPCTLQSYWSINGDSMLLQEVVHPADPIGDRMRQRLKDTIDEVQKRTENTIKDIQAKYDAGKPPTRAELKSAIDGVSNIASLLQSNTEFVVEQAVEETTAVVETAAIRIAMMAGMTTENMSVLAGQQYLKNLLPNHEENSVKPVESTIVPAPTSRAEQPGPKT